jgi:glycosyltransferase involved in cell wall biosynthesis
MNIVVLHSELGVLRGGGENFTRNLFQALIQRGHQVSAVFIADTNGRYPISLPEGIQPIPLSGFWSRKMGQRTLSRFGAWIPRHLPFRDQWDRVQSAMCWRIVRWHDRRFTRRAAVKLKDRWEEFDAAYVHGNPTLASKVASFCPTILRLPGPVPAEHMTAIKKVQMVCANGDALTQLRQSIGDQVMELPIGIDTGIFRPGTTTVRTRLGWSRDQWVIGYVGRLAYVKGIDVLARAFLAIHQVIPNIRLLIIGAGEEEGKLRQDLRSELRCGVVHIESDVIHHQLPDWYRAMDLFVLPSRYENRCQGKSMGMSAGNKVRTRYSWERSAVRLETMVGDYRRNLLTR